MNKWGGHVSKNVATMDMSVHFSSLHTNTIVQSCSPPYLYIHKRQVKNLSQMMVVWQPPHSSHSSSPISAPSI